MKVLVYYKLINEESGDDYDNSLELEISDQNLELISHINDLIATSSKVSLIKFWYSTFFGEDPLEGDAYQKYFLDIFYRLIPRLGWYMTRVEFQGIEFEDNKVISDFENGIDFQVEPLEGCSLVRDGGNIYISNSWGDYSFALEYIDENLS